MAAFSIRFLISNLYIALFIAILYMVKHLMKKQLSGRTQYRLWFFMLFLLPFPFLPFQPAGFFRISSWISSLQRTSLHNAASGQPAVTGLNVAATELTRDLSVSVTGNPDHLGTAILGLWLFGIGIMILYFSYMKIHMHRIERTALPLQNKEAKRLYEDCMKELFIRREIPVYTTAYISSPFTAGILTPRIYLPLHLVSDFCGRDMRYMFLHELQHYKHKDSLLNFFMNLSLTVYWFNPLVWFALKRMRDEREVACDSSVLQMLGEDEYKNYGMVLLNFARKMSERTIPFVSEMGGNKSHIKERILNIASYHRCSTKEKVKGICICILATALLFIFIPLLPAHAESSDYAPVPAGTEDISYADLRSHFGTYDGSFVLFDASSEHWTIYNKDLAQTRFSPDSSYKIYDALQGLDAGIITPGNSQMAWDGSTYPFDSWMADQNLDTAMHNSVNWYFQSIDSRLDRASVKEYLHRIGYGNEQVSGDLTTYWLESDLKISPSEQVALLRDFYYNKFGFAPENIEAVKKAILTASGPEGSLYGKTGTGQIDGQEIRGWFIGFIERSENPVFFACYIQDEEEATGSRASDITYSILEDMNIWTPEP